MACFFEDVVATAVVNAGTSVQITTTPVTLRDGARYRLLIPASVTVPSGVEALPVTVINGADAIPLWTPGPARSVLANRLPLFATACPTLGFVIPMEYVNTGIPTNPLHFTVLRRGIVL